MQRVGRVRSRPVDRLLACTASLLLASGMGCGDDAKEGCGTPADPCPPGAYLELTSTTNLFVNLGRAYVERNSEQYARLFAEDFVFEFSPKDAANEETPRSWPRFDEMESARNLFADATVDRITLDLVVPTARPAVAADLLPTTEGISVFEFDAVRLSVFTENEEGDFIELRVDGDPCVFFLRDDGDATAAKWQVVRWRDEFYGALSPNAHAIVDHPTWGQIKNLYR